MTQTLRRQYGAANEPDLNSFQDLFDRQEGHFATGVTGSYEWRIEQFDPMGRLLADNETALQRTVAQDFKTASQEYVLETLACLSEVAFQKSQLKDWMAPVEALVPRSLAATGHRGVVYRDPYGVALIIAPFNGPLLLLLRGHDRAGEGGQRRTRHE